MNVLLVFLALSIAAEPSDEEKKKYEDAARAAINATAAAIDACTERYLEENPGTQGDATVSVKIVKGGAVGSARIDTALSQARSIRDCLERIARGWRFPAPQTEQPDDLSLKIPVKKGAKFKLYAPGEQRPPEKAAEPEGFLQFAPSFLRKYDDKGQE
jgi:hypothetical protein